MNNNHASNPSNPGNPDNHIIMFILMITLGIRETCDDHWIYVFNAGLIITLITLVILVALVTLVRRTSLEAILVLL